MIRRKRRWGRARQLRLKEPLPPSFSLSSSPVAVETSIPRHFQCYFTGDAYARVEDLKEMNVIKIFIFGFEICTIYAFCIMC